MKLFEISRQMDLFNSSIEEVGQLLLKYCRPYLEETDYDVQKYRMFRGLNLDADAPNFFMKRARLKNRTPKSTNRYMHQDINDVFIKKFGLPFRNGIFATGSLSIAATYGRIYIVYPIGDFKYLWSKDVNDLFMHTSEILASEIEGDDRFKYQTTDLKTAILSGNEIMIWAKKYYVNSLRDPSELEAIQKYIMDNK